MDPITIIQLASTALTVGEAAFKFINDVIASAKKTDEMTPAERDAYQALLARIDESDFIKPDTA
jgi:hypothetical protein